MTITETLPPPSDPVNRFVISACWEEYEAFGRAFQDRNIKATFDGFTLELLTTTFEHETLGLTLALLVRRFCDELGIHRIGAGSTTLQRRDLEFGIEPHQSFYLDNCDRMLGKRDLDLTVDPPPDLVIEVEIIRSRLNRLRIFQAIGVPEIWRIDRHHFWILQRDSTGEYRESQSSRFFPQIPRERIHAFALRGWRQEENAFEREVRDWLRERIAANWKTD